MDEEKPPWSLDVPIPHLDLSSSLRLLQKATSKGSLEPKEWQIIRDAISNLPNLDPEEDPIYSFAAYLISKGEDALKVFSIIGWGGFEKLVSLILGFLDFKTKVNLHFRTLLGNRREIDILAFRRPVILSIDCKNWLQQAPSLSGLVQASEAQHERTLELADVLSDLSYLLPISHWPVAKIYPLIISAKGERVIYHNGSAIIPVHFMKPFVSNIQGDDELRPILWQNIINYEYEF